MQTFEKFEQDPKALLWEQLDDESTVLLDVEGHTDFMQPMSAKPDLKSDLIWFFSHRDNRRLGELQGSPLARICLTSDKNKVWADIRGRIQVSDYREAVANQWSAGVEAWYDQGKDDPDLQLLAFIPEEAEISVATANPVKYSWETVKALFGDQKRPEISEQKRIVFQ